MLHRILIAVKEKISTADTVLIFMLWDAPCYKYL